MQVSKVGVFNQFSVNKNQKSSVRSQQNFGRVSGGADGWYDGTMQILHTAGWSGQKYSNSGKPLEAAADAIRTLADNIPKIINGGPAEKTV